jgi:Ca2+-binding RTX toxin-like protein
LLGTASAESFFGYAGDDIIDAGAGDDLLDGGAGYDVLIGGAGNDQFLLGRHHDAVIDTSGTDTITSTISRNLASYSGIENLKLLGMKNISGIGNKLSNTLTGNDALNLLAGGLGNDRLLGLGGNDILTGGAGRDISTGGLGNDIFRFNTAPNTLTNRDVITDFSNAVGNNDTIQLSDAVFTKLGAGGTRALNPGFFHVGPAAADANDHIIYNKATGALFYDTNGNAAGGVIQIATLTNHAALTAADFVVL